FQPCEAKGFRQALWQNRMAATHPRGLSCQQGSSYRHLPRHSKALRSFAMIDLPYSLVIEATEEPDFFGFYSPDLEGFSGIGHSIEDCMYQAKWGMAEHVRLLREQGLPVPPPTESPQIVIKNEQLLQRA